MKDKQGRPYLKLAEAAVGKMVKVDGDFTCLAPWSEHAIEHDGDGAFIRCSDGKHHLSGQADDGENCIGVYPA